MKIPPSNEGDRMKVLAVLLVTALSAGIVSPAINSSPDLNGIHAAESSSDFHAALNATQEESYSTTPAVIIRANDETTSQASESVTSMSDDYDDLLLSEHAKPFFSPKNILLQEIRTLDEVASNDKNEVAKTLKAEAQRTKLMNPTTKMKSTTVKSNDDTTFEDRAMKKLFEAEDFPYEDDLNEDEEDETDGDGDDNGDGDGDGEIDYQEFVVDAQVMTQCPNYCRCAGEYAAATTATCTKLVEEQAFGAGIAHLRIVNAEQIRLGPHALRSRGLQKLKSLTIANTRIVELNQTAFDGVQNLLSVNLTRNGLQEIPPNIFQNNTQLSLLTISGNPLKHTQDSKSSKHGLFDIPAVTEFDFSSNGVTKLKRTAFTKMQNLNFINLKNNKLRAIDGVIFNGLESLEEVDLSNNLLSEIPVDLFDNNGVETLRIAGNNLTRLSTIQASKLTLLDASNNKIKIIAKDDLAGMPLLDQLFISSNGLKRIHEHAFANFEQLTYLDISDNKLTSLTEHHLRTNSRLQTLLMNDNPDLRILPVFKTTGLEYNTYNVYRFECANCGLQYLEKETLTAMPAITRLNLSRNRLAGLPNGLLSGLSSLRSLDLSDNIISSLEINMFRGAHSLIRINLAGNLLVKLQVAPFLMTPGLTKLDVSRNALERVWSEARVPLTSLRFLSVRENYLQRITTEELRATPKIFGLDLSHNPLNCDDEFNEAIQWLTDQGVTPMESLKNGNNYGNAEHYLDSDGISQWTDLAKKVCDGINDGPPDRSISQKEKKLNIILSGLDISDESNSLLRSDFVDNDVLLPLQIDHGLISNEDLEKAWTTQNQEYEDFVAAENMEYHPWYVSAVWPVLSVIIITMVILLLTVNVAIYLARRKGRGPVIRPPMILRQGLMDNKNCGLVYKPLQEEIATPHVPKRGSFYSSSTFHYDKIVPESV
ncbi:leucine-rich repeat domain-containing glycoprotein 150 isoform X1 [Ptiloglossa arizonensis]|uniref:leucine-rich repeat domain-containing glycoprotein 150 isoform X1 n=2 Tax=Ptiloglossa arizonensis TaxID=3350558 RepID=UPI003FA0AEFC